MITSCICPNSLWLSRMAHNASMRSSKDSPIPISRPVVNGIFNAPAVDKVWRRRCGSLSGHPLWQRRSSFKLSSIMPWLGLTSLSAASSSSNNAPALACGSSPVSSRTKRHMATK